MNILQIEKDLKAFEIIKPFIGLYKQHISIDYYYLVVRKNVYEVMYIEITKDQYDLLKEVIYE